MRKDKELIIATRKYAREDRLRSWWCLISTLLLFFLAEAGAIVDVHWAVQLFCSVVAGLLLVRLFTMYHDYLHRAILPCSRLAEFIFTIYGWYVLAPVSIWRRSHDFHHHHNSKLYTSSIGSFPLVTKKAYLAASPIERGLYLFNRHPFTIGFGYLFVFLWGMVLRSFINNPKEHWDSLLAICFHFGVGASIYFMFGWQSLILGFFLPAIISCALGAYMFYAQHNFPSATFKSKEEWNYVYAALHSSSYMKMGVLMNWFTGNIGYHHIHHINPSIPFYNLPVAFQEMEEFQNPGTTSLMPKDIAACFNVSVWDPEQGKMISLDEITTPPKRS